MLRAILIDDEPSGIDMLKTLITRNQRDIRAIASSMDPEEAIDLIEDFRPDVVFLDISMPDMNGFELLQRLDYHDFKLVFTTAHREYAIDALRNRAFDYLLKPINHDDFTRCVFNLVAERQKAPSLISQVNSHTYIELLEKDGINFLRLDDIVRLEASRSYTIFHLEDGTRHTASKAMKEFELRLDPGRFYRCHNSHIVNLHKVKKFVNHQGYFALMKDGFMVDISKKCKDEFLEKLKTL